MLIESKYAVQFPSLCKASVVMFDVARHAATAVCHVPGSFSIGHTRTSPCRATISVPSWMSSRPFESVLLQ
jgi:hypothetical protein